MAKVIAIGAAVQDVFLSGKVFKAVCEFDGDCVEEFPLGAKLEVDDIVISTGGGGTNAAVTFARQGLESQFIGVIGKDEAGELVLRDLEKEKVDTSDIIKTDKFHTGYSTLMLSPNGERTILTYRGASEHFDKADFDLEHIEADWLYITSLAGNLDLLGYLLQLAQDKKIKVAFDPGKRELEKSDELKKLLPKLTLLKANRDELGKLTEGKTAEEIVKELIKNIPLVVVTDGAAGAVASDGKIIIKAGIYEDLPVVDRTGAGDAFGSGIVAALAKGQPLEQAITLGSANSTSVVGKIGAKTGILTDGTKLHDMPLQITKL